MLMLMLMCLSTHRYVQHSGCTKKYRGSNSLANSLSTWLAMSCGAAEGRLGNGGSKGANDYRPNVAPSPGSDAGANAHCELLINADPAAVHP
jgi:hypothetical protein